MLLIPSYFDEEKCMWIVATQTHRVSIHVGYNINSKTLGLVNYHYEI